MYVERHSLWGSNWIIETKFVCSTLWGLELKFFSGCSLQSMHYGASRRCYLQIKSKDILQPKNVKENRLWNSKHFFKTRSIKNNSKTIAINDFSYPNSSSWTFRRRTTQNRIYGKLTVNSIPGWSEFQKMSWSITTKYQKRCLLQSERPRRHIPCCSQWLKESIHGWKSSERTPALWRSFFLAPLEICFLSFSERKGSAMAWGEGNSQGRKFGFMVTPSNVLVIHPESTGPQPNGFRLAHHQWALALTKIK